LILFSVILKMHKLYVLFLGLTCIIPLCYGKKDYYKSLEIERGASLTDIKKAFRKMALKYHPDKNPGKDTTKKFREIAEAYEVLGDESRRRQYDQMGHNAWSAPGTDGFKPGNFDFEDLVKSAGFEAEFFKDMDAGMKAHFAAHFGHMKAAHGDAFNPEDLNLEETFKPFMNNADNFEDVKVEIKNGQTCKTIKHKVGNTETVQTQCTSTVEHGVEGDSEAKKIHGSDREMDRHGEL